MKTKRRFNKKNNLTKKITNYYSIPSDVSFAAEAVSNNPTSTNMKRFVSKITTNIKRTQKSFSPEINAKLKTMTRAPRSNIFSCGASTALKRTKTSGSMRIGVGSRKNNTHKCVSADSKSGQKALLRNFASQKKIACNTLTMPAQRYANCWFNCMFAAFFVSDKGRKFMRAFRQTMIEGKLLDGTLIKPTKLRNALLLLNMAIEACYNTNTELDLAINTNNIISGVYKSLPTSYENIKNIKESGNPYYFYDDLITYLGGKSTNSPKMITLKNDIDVKNFFDGNMSWKSQPDIIVVQITDLDINNRALSKKYKNKPLQISNETGITYKLDSVVIRNINGNHFSACVRCNKKEFVYDGAVLSQLVSMNWSKLYNKNKLWNIQDSLSTWNFMNGYFLAFYYRIK